MVKLTCGFTFLKKRFRFTESGRIVVTPSTKSLARERRKLRIHARMVAEGSMTLEQAYVSYMSFRGSLERKRGDGRPRFRMDVHWIVRDFTGCSPSSSSVPASLTPPIRCPHIP